MMIVVYQNYNCVKFQLVFFMGIRLLIWLQLQFAQALQTVWLRHC